MHQLQQIAHQNPQWSLDELVEVANQLLPQYLPDQGADQGSDSRLQDTVNARLVRHYTTQGLLDRPLKQGREARYLYRHLLQLLLLRRLLTEGYNSGSLVQALQKTNRDLENLLQGGAQLTMEAANPALAFLAKVRDRGPGPPPQAGMSAPPSSPRRFSPPSPPPSAPRAEQAYPDRQTAERRDVDGQPAKSQSVESSRSTRDTPSPLDNEEVAPNVADEVLLNELADFDDDLDLSFDLDFEAAPEDVEIALEASDLAFDLSEESAFEASVFSSAAASSAPSSPGFSTSAPSANANASPDAEFEALFDPAPLAPITADASLWSRHTILDGLELHLRADFIYPSTPQERDTLLRIIADRLRFLASYPPSHTPPSHRRPPP